MVVAFCLLRTIVDGHGVRNLSRRHVAAALQQEARADGREVGDLRSIQRDVPGSTFAQARHDLFRLPSLAVEVRDVAVHEHRTSVAERGEALRGESGIGICLDQRRGRVPGRDPAGPGAPIGEDRGGDLKLVPWKMEIGNGTGN